MPTRLRFTLHDDSAGYAISPARVPLAWLREFVREVEDFVRGSERGSATAEMEVGVVEGSLALESAAPTLPAALLADLARMAESELLDELDPRRCAVVQSWQQRAKRNPRRRYGVGAIDGGPRIEIGFSSDFRLSDADRWVETERVVRGLVYDAGGKTSANVHLQLADGTSLTVAADKGLLGRQPTNPLYKPALLRIRARYNVVTREHRDAVLIDFIDYEPRFSEAERQRLVAEGTRAWADAEGAERWVETLRGNA